MPSLTDLFHRLFPSAPGTAAHARLEAEKTRRRQQEKSDADADTWAAYFEKSLQGKALVNNIQQEAAKGKKECYSTLIPDSKWHSDYAYGHPTLIGAERFLEKRGFRVYTEARNYPHKYDLTISW